MLAFLLQFVEVGSSDMVEENQLGWSFHLQLPSPLRQLFRYLVPLSVLILPR